MKNIVVDGKEIEFYLADENGNIYNKEGKLMKQHLTRNGYLRVKLSRGLDRKMYLVHRIIAETFIPNPSNYPIVNHLDSVRDNNKVSNLEWTDNSHNQKQRYDKNGYVGTKRKKVAQIDSKTGEVIKIWEYIELAEKELGICSQNIGKVASGKRKSAGGYKWLYV